MSSGIADAGMYAYKQNKPTPLPVQALDHATGYLLAAAAIRLLTNALSGKGLGYAKLSLARTAELLKNSTQTKNNPQALNGLHKKTPTKADFQTHQEQTPWGKANRLRSPFTIQGTEIIWNYPANNLGTSSAQWSKNQVY